MTPATLDIPEAAAMLKVHPKTVADMISSGALPAAKIGRSYVMMTKDVLDHIEQQIIYQTAKRMGAPGRSETSHQSRSARSEPRKLA